MAELKTLVITEEMERNIEKWFGKPLSQCTDEDAVEIVKEYIDKEISYASFSTEDEIYYRLAEEDEEDEEDAPYKSFSEDYLNYIGMSMADFI